MQEKKRQIVTDADYRTDDDIEEEGHMLDEPQALFWS